MKNMIIFKLSQHYELNTLKTLKARSLNNNLKE